MTITTAAAAAKQFRAAILTVVLAIVAALPPTLLAWAALNASRENSHKVDRVADRTNVAVDKADTLIVKTEQIHALTNNNLSQVTAALANANTKIEGLERMMIELSKREAKATVIAIPVAPTPVVVP